MNLERRTDYMSELHRQVKELLERESLVASEQQHGIDVEKTKELLKQQYLYQLELEIQNEELRRIQLELEKSRSQYFDLYHCAPVGYLTLDQWGLIQNANRTATHLLGVHTKENLIKEPLHRFIHPADQDTFYLNYKEIYQLLGNKSWEIRLLHRDSSPIWVNITMAIVDGKEEGEPLCHTIIMDISRQKEAEERLTEAHLELEKRVRERTKDLEKANTMLQAEIIEHNRATELLQKSEEHFRRIVELMSIAVFEHNQESIIFGNSAAAHLMDVAHSQELVGMSLFTFLHIEDQETFYQQLTNVLNKPIDKESMTARLYSTTGREIDVEMHFTPSLHQGAPVVHITAYNISRRRREEEEIQKVDKLESIGLLAGGIAHDFNNFLATMMANINLAKMYGQDIPKLLKRINNIESAIMKGKDLANQLFTFSKGGAPLKENVSIKELITSDIQFSLSGSNTLPDIVIDNDLHMVKVDKGQFSQVLSNLTINAIQAMPEGGSIRVRAKNIALNKDDNNIFLPLKRGSYVKITIEDEGTGIPEEYLKKIFDPFFTTKEKGKGLGLATSYSIIKNHGGYLHVESKPGQGTTFSIYLPSIEKIDTTSSSHKKIFKGTGRILFMDDEEDLLIIMEEMLSSLGYSVTLARDGKEATEHYLYALHNNEPFDLVIMDLTIPGEMGGIQTIRELIKIHPEVKAIVASGYSSNPVMANYVDYGFKGALKKPFTIESLSEIIYHTISS